jgi:hypothetical protein
MPGTYRWVFPKLILGQLDLLIFNNTNMKLISVFIA